MGGGGAEAGRDEKGCKVRRWGRVGNKREENKGTVWICNLHTDNSLNEEQ